jgi:hypothetical protein
MRYKGNCQSKLSKIRNHIYVLSMSMNHSLFDVVFSG